MTGYQLVTVLIYINTDIYIEREIARDVDIDLIMEAWLGRTFKIIECNC